MARIVVAAPIDDFLDRAGSSSVAARAEGLGAGLSLAGATLGVGLLVLVAIVHVGTSEGVRRLLRLVMVSGMLLAAGAALEVAATADELSIGWAEAVTDGSAASAMMRLLAGVFLLLAFIDETASVGGLAGTPGTATTAPTGSASPLVRWVPGRAAPLGFAGIAIAVVSFAYDGHTVTEGPRVVHALVDVVHVTSGGVWGGGVVGLAALAMAPGSPVGASFDRFAPIATVALAPVAVSGVIMAVFVLEEPGDLATTPWGRALVVKIAAVALMMVVGLSHHRTVRQRRRTEGLDPLGAPTLRWSLLVETALVLAVVISAAVLVRSSNV